jgi:male-specific lethal 1
MAKAIETSDIILLCITEKYRQSINCQAEAQYAFKLQKHIVPLIMQEGYERVDGWLGMIIGDKIYINFIKYDINEATRRLIHEIGLKFKAEYTASSLPKFGKTSVKLLKSIPKPVQEDETQNKKDLIQKWSEKEVKKWFDENKFHEKIFKEMDPCDGDLLFQMHILQIEAPEFFYQSITKDKSVDLKSALIFSKKLKELFNS